MRYEVLVPGNAVVLEQSHNMEEICIAGWEEAYRNEGELPLE